MLKRIAILCVFFIVTGLFGAVQAQRGGDQFILKYGEELALTDAQKKQIM